MEQVVRIPDNEVISREVQKKLYELGYRWSCGGREIRDYRNCFYYIYDNGNLTWRGDLSHASESCFRNLITVYDVFHNLKPYMGQLPYSTGNIFKHSGDGELYMLSQVDTGKGAMICLENGNRFHLPSSIEHARKITEQEYSEIGGPDFKYVASNIEEYYQNRVV